MMDYEVKFILDLFSTIYNVVLCLLLGFTMVMDIGPFAFTANHY